jgi:hypothetical protein
VFGADAQPSLRAWLEASGLVPRGSDVSTFSVNGGQEGVRVKLRQMLAPNEFIYVAGSRRIYRLTPLGSHSEQMLASFRVL